jgi:hypothetical protein
MRSFMQKKNLSFLGLWVVPAFLTGIVITGTRVLAFYNGEKTGIYGGPIPAWAASCALGNLISMLLSANATITIAIWHLRRPQFRSALSRQWVIGLFLPQPFFLYWYVYDQGFIAENLSSLLFTATIILSPALIVAAFSISPSRPGQNDRDS